MLLRLLTTCLLLASHAGADDFFANHVWAKIGARSCIKCHKLGGDAEDSEFILDRSSPTANLDAFTSMAKLYGENGRSRILLKVVGELDHGGEDVLAGDSGRYRILEEFVNRANGSPPSPQFAPQPTTPFFTGVEMLPDQRLLRRLCLSLAARLPTATEQSTVTTSGIDAIPAILDALMAEDAFYDRLAEGFNDIFLTPGIDDVAENVLSYEHFEKTRHWYQKWDFNHIEDEKERERAGWKLADHYRESMQREPMELVKHIVRNDLPFTELITADYIMVSPMNARGYGIFDEVKHRFKNLDDRFEYIPVRLPALTGRSEKTNQQSTTGFYPHAGIFSTFQYLKRYPTTETNRNRLRVRMFFQHFLGIDIMQLAPRVNDAAAISAEYENPTMEATDCVVCHRVIDPVAGLLQDYYALDGKGVYHRRKQGWFTDMFPPGFGPEALPESERWRALQWLAERTAKDPRFAVAMVGHAWYILTGRQTLRPPDDFDHPLYDSRLRAYTEQRTEIESVATQFAATGFNLKLAFKQLALSKFYRADGLATATTSPRRLAEIDDLGLVRLLSPEQLERKITAVFGNGWGRLHDQFKILYGGIDTKEVTERIADPSGAMGAIQRMMANEVACKNVALDFAADPQDRRLFPSIELDTLPSPETETQLHAAITHLHNHVLGHSTPEETTRTYTLFKEILTEAKNQPKLETSEIYHCRVNRDQPLPDPHYTLRAWRAVLTYLLRQHQFLYE
ncbi:MAG: DUF1592 domain-containing protein [Verrucomicrobiales bacterium]|nr:DUF1592 domain-containing protein [Verrucomicrobiales bacterium]